MQIKLMLLLLALSKPQANLKVDGAKLKNGLFCNSRSTTTSLSAPEVKNFVPSGCYEVT